jgi:hypothetical protein
MGRVPSPPPVLRPKQIEEIRQQLEREGKPFTYGNVYRIACPEWVAGIEAGCNGPAHLGGWIGVARIALWSLLMVGALWVGVRIVDHWTARPVQQVNAEQPTE